MSDHSAIEWTDATWNPTTGCTKISPGCAHCYIERTPAFRIKGRQFENGRIPLELHTNRLEQPLHWRRPRRVFVNSLSDLFHEDVPDAFIDHVFAVMALASQHTFQVLTKRAARLVKYFTDLEDEWGESRAWWSCGQAIETADEWIPDGSWTNKQRDQIEENPLPKWPLPNVWLGVSVENQHFADERIPLLLQTPAAVRFISAEPLLGPVDLLLQLRRRCYHDVLRGFIDNEYPDQPRQQTAKLDWVIVGGESGPRSRDCCIDWIRSIQCQCEVAGVRCFTKQLGRQPRVADGVYLNLKDKKGGDLDEWPIDLRVREFPRSTGNVSDTMVSQT